MKPQGSTYLNNRVGVLLVLRMNPLLLLRPLEPLGLGDVAVRREEIDHAHGDGLPLLGGHSVVS